MSSVTVIKLDLDHKETWRYPGKILKQEPNLITIEAFFNRPDLPFHGILLRQGDKFIETFFFDRWFNVFAIYDQIDKSFKGLYCNISYPAQLKSGCVSYVDLALDLLVYPDGTQLILDEDEFAQLSLPKEIKLIAENTLTEVKIYCTEVLAEFV